MTWLADRLHGGGEMLVAPGAFDAMSARAIADHGFEAFYCGGYAGIASAWGLPDLGLLGLGEMRGIYERLRACCSLPMIVDADTGYGGLLNVARTVSTLAALGVSAVQIEDQLNPKRCGHIADKEVAPLTEAEQRVRVAVEVGAEHGVAIIARTDALERHGLAAALDRANRFLELGATAAFIDALHTVEEIAAVPRALQGPAVYNAADTGLAPRLSTAQLSEFGYAMTFFPIELLAASDTAVHAALDNLAEHGQLDGVARTSFTALNSSLGLTDLVAWEKAIADEQDTTIGSYREEAS
ncbi:isocitrate lyase/PEP mutase family protein [Nocardia nepalensis]|uniref:isocitrate lyase/PEP mutase family protein n=1 Tax=Nocardia nepalensis TaxID=3375448 RepID=UPI003B6754C5